MYSARLRTTLGAGILFAASLPFACNTEVTDPTDVTGGGSVLFLGGGTSVGQDPSGGSQSDPGDPNSGGTTTSANGTAGQTGGTPPNNNLVVIDNRPVTMVTTLEDSPIEQITPIPGSIRWAVENAPTPGVIRFAVGGAIGLKWTLAVKRPDLEIDGSTAPNGGITFQQQQFEVRDTRNVVLKHLRFRSGDGFLSDADRVAAHGEYYDVNNPDFKGGVRSLAVLGEHGPCRDVRVENCSIQNSTDDNCSVWGDCAGISFYRCLFSGGYTHVTKGMLCGTEIGDPIVSDPNWLTIQQCLFLDQWGRMPDLYGNTAHLVNNVILRPMQGGRLTNTKANVVGNCLFTMPNHPWYANADRVLVTVQGTTTPGCLYVSGNLLDGVFDDYTKIVGIMNRGQTLLPASTFRPDPLPGLPGNIVSAPQALHDVLTHAGCEAPGRDQIDLVEMARAAEFTGVDVSTLH